jgi:hypothetical protein
LGSIDDPLLFFGAQRLGADDEDQSAGGLMTSSSDTDLAIKGITSASMKRDAILKAARHIYGKIDDWSLSFTSC